MVGEGGGGSPPLKPGVDRDHVDLTHPFRGVKLERHESDGPGTLRCDPDVHVLFCADGFDRVLLRHAPVRMLLEIDVGIHRALDRVKDRLPGS